jgi:uncharacterized protein DUF6459
VTLDRQTSKGLQISKANESKRRLSITSGGAMPATVISEHVCAPTQRWGFRVRSAPTPEAPFDDEPLQIGTMHPFADASGVAAAPGRPAEPLPAGSSTPAAARYVRVCIEVLNGFRPPSHLRTLTGPVEFDEILRQLRFRRNAAHAGTDGRPVAAAVNAAPGRPKSVNLRHPSGMLGNGAMPGGNDRNAAGPAQSFRLRRLRVTEPLPGIAEVVAVLAQAGQTRALAMRLEAHGPRWVCTVVQVV